MGPAPGDSESFSASGTIPGFDDGDYPEWPAQEMLEWMPADIVSRFGQGVNSVLNGEFWSYLPIKRARSWMPWKQPAGLANAITRSWREPVASELWCSATASDSVLRASPRRKAALALPSPT